MFVAPSHASVRSSFPEVAVRSGSPGGPRAVSTDHSPLGGVAAGGEGWTLGATTGAEDVAALVTGGAVEPLPEDEAPVEPALPIVLVVSGVVVTPAVVVSAVVVAVVADVTTAFGGVTAAGSAVDACAAFGSATGVEFVVVPSVTVAPTLGSTVGAGGFRGGGFAGGATELSCSDRFAPCAAGALLTEAGATLSSVQPSAGTDVVPDCGGLEVVPDGDEIVEPDVAVGVFAGVFAGLGEVPASETGVVTLVGAPVGADEMRGGDPTVSWMTGGVGPGFCLAAGGGTVAYAFVTTGTLP
jgi:hypothetical protein